MRTKFKITPITENSEILTIAIVIKYLDMVMYNVNVPVFDIVGLTLWPGDLSVQFILF